VIRNKISIYKSCWSIIWRKWTIDR